MGFDSFVNRLKSYSIAITMKTGPGKDLMTAVITIAISDAVFMVMTGEGGGGEEGERIHCHRSKIRPSTLAPSLRL